LDVRRDLAATTGAAALIAGCAGGSDGMRVSLADVDPAGGFWAIRATCQGGDLDVEFRPGEQVAVPGFGHASGDEIAVECGEPVRVMVTNEELRRRKPTGADLATPTSESTELSCIAEGPLVVSAHPVWDQNTIVSGAVSIERRGDTILRGVISTKESGLPSQLQWWRAVCSR
jgi:hypothetical protein